MSAGNLFYAMSAASSAANGTIPYQFTYAAMPAIASANGTDSHVQATSNSYYAGAMLPQGLAGYYYAYPQQSGSGPGSAKRKIAELSSTYAIPVQATTAAAGAGYYSLSAQQQHQQHQQQTEYAHGDDVRDAKRRRIVSVIASPPTGTSENATGTSGSRKTCIGLGLYVEHQAVARKQPRKKPNTTTNSRRTNAAAGQSKQVAPASAPQPHRAALVPSSILPAQQIWPSNLAPYTSKVPAGTPSHSLVPVHNQKEQQPIWVDSTGQLRASDSFLLECALQVLRTPVPASNIANCATKDNNTDETARQDVRAEDVSTEAAVQAIVDAIFHPVFDGL